MTELARLLYETQVEKYFPQTQRISLVLAFKPASIQKWAHALEWLLQENLALPKWRYFLAELRHLEFMSYFHSPATIQAYKKTP